MHAVISLPDRDDAGRVVHHCSVRSRDAGGAKMGNVYVRKSVMAENVCVNAWTESTPGAKPEGLTLKRR